MISTTVIVWAAFLILIACLLALDLGVFHRKARVVSLPEALGWTAVWISLAMVFNVGVYYLYELNPAGWDMDTQQLSGGEAALQFFTGFVLEKSLSVDNIFVIAMVFAQFRVPLAEQHRVLFWGIFGAIVLRALMIFAGVALLQSFAWIVYVFGALLIYSAASMMVIRHDTLDADGNLVIRLAKRYFPVTEQFHGSRFFIRQNGVLCATPLFLALLLVEASDVMFAVDSIPAILAITRDPFLVLTSNVFALLGLRSLFFVLAGLMEKFRYLKTSLVFLLAYVGVKMMLVHHFPIPNLVSLAVIGGILMVGVLASILASHDPAALLSPMAGELDRIAIASYRQARNAAILMTGSAVLLAGIAIAVAPGPALLVTPFSLALLALAFALVLRWLKQVKAGLALSGRR